MLAVALRRDRRIDPIIAEIMTLWNRGYRRKAARYRGGSPEGGCQIFDGSCVGGADLPQNVQEFLQPLWSFAGTSSAQNATPSRPVVRDASGSDVPARLRPHIESCRPPQVRRAVSPGPPAAPPGPPGVVRVNDSGSNDGCIITRSASGITLAEIIREPLKHWSSGTHAHRPGGSRGPSSSSISGLCASYEEAAASPAAEFSPVQNRLRNACRLSDFPRRRGMPVLAEHIARNPQNGVIRNLSLPPCDPSSRGHRPLHSRLRERTTAATAECPPLHAF